MSEVLVLVDHVDGLVRKPTYELLTIARRLGEPSAVFIGPVDAADAVVDACRPYGAGEGLRRRRRRDQGLPRGPQARRSSSSARTPRPPRS